MRAPPPPASFEPGQFFRLQNYEALRRGGRTGSRLTMEGLALTGAWIDKTRGLLSLIVLEMGGSSRLCARLEPGRAGGGHGPDRDADRDRRPARRSSCAAAASATPCSSRSAAALRAQRAAGCSTSPPTAGARTSTRSSEIEAAADQVIWSVDGGELPDAAPPAGPRLRGNVVQAMEAYAQRRARRGAGAAARVPPHHRHRQRPHDERGQGARATACCAPHFRPGHVAIALDQLAHAVHDEGGLRAVPAAPHRSRRPARRRSSSPAPTRTSRRTSSTGRTWPIACARTRCRKS